MSFLSKLMFWKKKPVVKVVEKASPVVQSSPKPLVQPTVSQPQLQRNPRPSIVSHPSPARSSFYSGSSKSAANHTATAPKASTSSRMRNRYDDDSSSIVSPAMAYESASPSYSKPASSYSCDSSSSWSSSSNSSSSCDSSSSSSSD